MVVLWAYQSLVRRLRPFNVESFNYFEITIMNLLMFNIIATKYLLVSHDEETWVSYLSLIVTLILNGAFVIMLMIKILSLTLLEGIALVERKIMKRNVERNHDPLQSSDSSMH